MFSSFFASEEHGGRTDELAKDRSWRPKIHLLIKTALRKLKETRVSLFLESRSFGIFFSVFSAKRKIAEKFGWNLESRTWRARTYILLCGSIFHIATLLFGGWRTLNLRNNLQ